MSARKDARKATKIRELIKRWDDQWKYNKNIYHEMTQFILGEQWKEDEAKLFETYKKIPLTVNKIAPLANHLLGEQRQNTPNLQIMPSADVDAETAEVREALIKEISLNSHARVIYQTCFQQAAIGGFSAYRVLTEYVDIDSFDQNIVMSSFRDPTKCYWDVSAESPCKTDGMHCGFRTTMSRKKFRALYGESIEKKIGTMTTDITDTDAIATSFSDEQAITVIDHFERKSKLVKVYQLSNGRTVRSKEFNALEKVEIDGMDILLDQGEPVTVFKEKEEPEYYIKHSKWGGDFELDITDFPSEQLPVPFVDQNSYFDKNGKQIIRPFFKDARDSQRYVNYLRTQMAYLVKISRYDQFLVSKQNVRSNDTEQIWRDPAIVQGGLVYDESPNGNVPIQLKPPELSQSLLLQYQEAANDIQVVTGMFDTQMGQQGNEISGAAIDARTRRGSFNTYVPFDSLNRAIACGGEIINEMIPKVYDTQREMNLEMKDRGRVNVVINEQVDEYGSGAKNDMSKGKFKIRLMPGPSFEGQKSEGLDSMDRMLQKDPESFRLVADLYAENLPMPNNIEIRNRYRTMVPPEIIKAGKTGQPIPPKEPEPDPMVMIKMQELQLKQQKLQMDMQLAQIKAQEEAQKIQLEEQKLLMQSHIEGANFHKELQVLESKKEESLAKLKEQEMRYTAELKRIEADLHMNHLQNTVKILTHQPNHFKAEKTKEGKQ